MRLSMCKCVDANSEKIMSTLAAVVGDLLMRCHTIHAHTKLYVLAQIWNLTEKNPQHHEKLTAFERRQKRLSLRCPTKIVQNPCGIFECASVYNMHVCLTASVRMRWEYRQRVDTQHTSWEETEYFYTRTSKQQQHMSKWTARRPAKKKKSDYPTVYFQNIFNAYKIEQEPVLEYRKNDFHTHLHIIYTHWRQRRQLQWQYKLHAHSIRL